MGGCLVAMGDFVAYKVDELGDSLRDSMLECLSIGLGVDDMPDVFLLVELASRLFRY